MRKTPSRVLNEKMNFLSLSVVDIAALGYVLIISHSILANFSLELLSFGILGIATSILISIRFNNRPKVVRDFISFAIRKKILKSNGAFK